MKNHNQQKSSKHLLWPLLVLVFLTIGVFVTTREIPKQQDVRTRAQVYQNPSLFSQDFSSVAEETPTPVKATPTPVSADATLNLAFALPGTATPGANTNPLHKTRNITINLYDTDTNTQDQGAIPLYTITATAAYDTDSQSSTYLQFVSKNLNLKDICASSGKCIPPGKYQIGLKTYQSLQKVVKHKETDFAGRIYELSNKRVFYIIFGEMIFGDIIPSPNGNNLIDADDISVVVNCLGDKMQTPSCIDQQGPDFDDNGVVDETDHAILLQGIAKVIELGGSVPTPTVSTQPVKKDVVSPSPLPETTSQSGNAGLFILGAIVALLIAGVLLLIKNKKFQTFLTKRKFEKKEYFIKKKSDDEEGKGIWLDLTDDSGIQLGHYAGMEIKEGFGHIKGDLREQNGKKFIEVTDIMWDEQR